MWTIFPIVLILAAGYMVLVWRYPGWMLALLPLTAGVPLAIGLAHSIDPYLMKPWLVYFEPDYIWLLLFALIFIVTVSLIHFKPVPLIDAERWYKIVSRILFKVFLWGLVLVALTAVFSVFGVMFFVFLMILMVHFKHTRRYSLVLDVVSTLSGAMRQNLPLPMAMETAAAHRSDRAAKIYRRLAGLLCEGRALSDALKMAYRDCPPEVIATLGVAETMHQLPVATTAIERDCLARIGRKDRACPIQPAYPLFIFAVGTLIVIGLCVFIVPTFADIISDMTGGQKGLPTTTQWLLELSALFGRFGFFLIVILTLLLILLMGLYAYHRSRRPERPRLLSRLGDWLKWHTPGVSYFERHCSLLRTIQSLRAGLKAGYSFDVVVQQTLRLDVNECFRSKLRRWLRQIQAGRPIADSAAACGLGHTLAWALDESVNKGNVPRLLEMLEELYRNRYEYRLNVAHSIMWPAVVMVLGGGVGFVMYAIFAAWGSMIMFSMDASLP